MQQYNNQKVMFQLFPLLSSFMQSLHSDIRLLKIQSFLRLPFLKIIEENPISQIIKYFLPFAFSQCDKNVNRSQNQKSYLNEIQKYSKSKCAKSNHCISFIIANILHLTNNINRRVIINAHSIQKRQIPHVKVTQNVIVSHTFCH